MEIFPSAAQLKKGPEGQLLSSNKNFRDAAGQTIRNITSSASTAEKSTQPNSQVLKQSGETLHYPLDVGNPAYRSRVTFEAFTFGLKKDGVDQKNDEILSKDNLATNTSATETTSQNDLSDFAPSLDVQKTLASTQELDGIAPPPPGSGGPFKNVRDTVGNLVGGALEKGGEALKGINDFDITRTAKKIFSSNADFFEAPGEPIVDMYFPNSVTFSDVANYANPELGFRGGAVEGAITGGGNAISGLGTAISDEFSNLFEFLNFKGSVATDTARLAFTRGMNLANKTLLGVGGGAVPALTLLNRVVVNPNVRALFSGVPLREFSFQFKMIATSASEAKKIEEIIRHFRKNLYPSSFSISLGEGPSAFNANVGIKFPNLFKIRFKFNGAENKKLPQIHFCYLRSVNHTVNPTGGGFRWDGQPNEIDLTLSFVEYRNLTSEDIKRGY